MKNYISKGQGSLSEGQGEELWEERFLKNSEKRRVTLVWK